MRGGHSKADREKWELLGFSSGSGTESSSTSCVQPDVGGQDTASNCGKPSSHHGVDFRLCHVLGWELGQRSRINDIEAEDERYVDG